jgi:hypothetical protein
MAAPQPNRLPPASLVPNLRDVATTPCNTCGRPVRGDFQPIYCHVHRNNVTPVSGWAFMLRTELRLVNILRLHRWTDDALAEVAARAQEIEVLELADGVETQLQLADGVQLQLADGVQLQLPDGAQLQLADVAYRGSDSDHTPDFSSDEDL